jgi:hypothetical protein
VEIKLEQSGVPNCPVTMAVAPPYNFREGDFCGLGHCHRGGGAHPASSKTSHWGVIDIGVAV